MESTDRQKKVLTNYWRAISNLLVEPDDETSIIFKTNGLHMFHSASPAIFLHLANVKDFKTETVKALMKRAFENLPVDYIGVSTPDFWKRGSTASGSTNPRSASTRQPFRLPCTASPAVKDSQCEGQRDHSACRAQRTVRAVCAKSVD